MRRISGLVLDASECDEAGAIVLPPSTASRDRVLSSAMGLRVDDAGIMRIGDAPVVLSAASSRALEEAKAKRDRKAARGW